MKLNQEGHPPREIIASREEIEKMGFTLDKDQPEEPNKNPKETPDSETELSHEQMESMQNFLLETYKSWGVEQTKLDNINFKLELVNPQNIDYTAKKDDIDTTKFGEYSLNPDTVNINWETIDKNKIKTFPLPEMQGKTLAEVVEHLKTTYADKYHIPGLEYYQYLYQNPDQIPPSMSEDKYYFFPGSLFRRSGGNLDVPWLVRDHSGLGRDGYWLGFSWLGSCRVALLEK